MPLQGKQRPDRLRNKETEEKNIVLLSSLQVKLLNYFNCDVSFYKAWFSFNCYILIKFTGM
jgi:hypothetical protein